MNAVTMSANNINLCAKYNLLNYIATRSSNDVIRDPTKMVLAVMNFMVIHFIIENIIKRKQKIGIQILVCKLVM